MHYPHVRTGVGSLVRRLPFFPASQPQHSVIFVILNMHEGDFSTRAFRTDPSSIPVEIGGHDSGILYASMTLDPSTIRNMRQQMPRCNRRFSARLCWHVQRAATMAASSRFTARRNYSRQLANCVGPA